MPYFLKYVGCIAGLLMLLDSYAQTNQPAPGRLGAAQHVDGLPGAYAATPTINYVRTREAKTPNTDAATFATSTYTDVQETTQYIDGLGRPVQTVVKQASAGTSPKDMVSPVTYDEFGREANKYLPYVQETGSNQNDGSFKTDPFVSQQSYYSTFSNHQNHGLDNEQVYYSKTVYEQSPLNRPVKTFAPGNSWAGTEIPNTQTRAAAENATSMEYLINTTNDDVKAWNIDNSNSLTNIPVLNTTINAAGNYSAGELYKNVTKDEHGKAVVEYKDKNGQVILKKVQIDDNIASNYEGYIGWLCTYYVYDDFGRLRFVISPKAVKWLTDPNHNNWDFSLTGGSDVVNELCFRYEYDGRSRMSAKKVPGAAWVYMVYDKRDRLVFTQDGNMRPNNQWMVTLYDVLNRPVQTGLMVYTSTTGDPVNDLQTTLDVLDYSITHPVITTGTTTNKILPVLTVPNREAGRGMYEASVEVDFDPGFESEDNADFTGQITPASVTNFTNSQDINGYTPPGNGWVPLTITHYDDYSFTTKLYNSVYNNTLTDGDNNQGIITYADNLPTTNNDAVRGLVTGSKVRVLTSTDLTVLANAPWLETRSYYDDKNRLVQVQSGNYKGGDDITTTRYDFTSKPVSMLTIHNNSSGNVTNLATLTEMKYDHAGRLTDVWKLADDLANITPVNNKKKLIAHNVYDELGQLKHKDIGQQTDPQTGVPTTAPMEGQDYAYNIRGWLKGINWDYTPTTGPTLPHTDYQNDRWFGMDLSYDWGYQHNEYNGNIAGMRWQSEGDKEQRAYGFGYDAANRLLFADFNQYTSNNWDKSAGINFSTKMGTGLNDGSAYDENGNIKSMQQNGLKLNTSPLIDDLAYNYYANSNKLSSVTDNSSTLDNKLGDFTDKNKTGDDYGYDVNGNMIVDKNKRINGTTGVDIASNAGAITYNHLNLPYEIKVKDDNGNDKGTIKYIYDATGNKLEKITDELASSLNNQTPKNTVTTYLGGYVYENNVLQFFGQEEGRIRKKVSILNSQPSTDFVYDYFLKDHLGNIRMVLTDEHEQHTYPAATLEDGATAIEKGFYDIVDGNIVNKPNGIPDYPNNNIVLNNNPTSNTTANSQKVYKLNGTGGGKTGLGITLRVMAGDVVDIFGKSYYNQNNANDNSSNNLPVLNLLTALLNAPGGAVAAAAHDAVTASQLNTISGNGVGGFLNNGNRIPVTSSIPRAYINYIIFDDHFRYVSGGLSPVGMNGIGAVTSHHDDPNMQNIAIPKNGYLYVYCSNESPVDVFFDNLQVIHTKGPLVEETHYYPFGLTMAGISSKAAGSLENKKKYNGIELDEDLGIEEYEAFFRDLDPQTGRWWQIDPKCEVGADDNEQGLESLSPYNSMANDPVLKSDPLGDAPCCGEAQEILRQTDLITSQIIEFGGGPTDYVTDAAATVVSVGGLLAAGVSALWELSSEKHVAAPHPAIPKAITHVQPVINTQVQVKKGAKDLVGEAILQKQKEEKAKENATKKQAQTARGNSRTGNSNKDRPGSHNSGGKNPGKHAAAYKRWLSDTKHKPPPPPPPPPPQTPPGGN